MWSLRRARLNLASATVFFELLTELGGHLVTGADLLAQIVAGEPSERTALAKRLRKAEHQADECTHAIIRRLNRSSLPPFSGEDLYALTSALDDCMDSMDEAADAVVNYQITELPALVTDQVAILQRAAELTAGTMPRLRAMRDVDTFWIEVNRLENEADQIHRRLTGDLFCDPHHLGSAEGVVDLIKIRTVVDSLEDAADHFERVANLVETIYLKTA